MKFSDEQFIEALRAAAAERPAFVYEADKSKVPACAYDRRGDQPGCLIGEALARLGVAQEVLHEYNGFAGEVLVGYGISDRVWRCAEKTQTKQDDEVTWGECAEYFNACLAG